MEANELLASRTDEHVAHEQGMVGTGADNADLDTVAFIPAGKAIDDVNPFAGVEVVDSTFSVNSPDLESPIDVSCSLLSLFSLMYLKI